MTEHEYLLLVDQLTTYEKAYYIDGRPLVSDLVYDGLFDKLRAFEKANPQLIVSYSPSQRAGSDLSQDFPEFRHTLPVLSLDKAYSIGEIQQFVQRVSQKSSQSSGGGVSIVGEQKIDGLSLVLYYEKGIFVRAVTRGNGEIGNDVSQNARTIKDLPLKLSKPITGAFRGEVYLEIEVFNELNKKLEAPYANPRNLAGGTLRRIKSNEVSQVPLRLFIYEGFYESSPVLHNDVLRELQDIGFRTNTNFGHFNLPSEFDKLELFLKDQTLKRKSLSYEIDGLVFKVDDLEARQRLGYTGHHPRWAIAYKFESPEGVTKLLSIDVQIGRTGRVTPVARVEPVMVGGATIQNVTLHNQDYINTLEVSPSDLVTISRRGDVIPAVEGVVEKGDQPVWHMPELCPRCQSKLELIGAHHFCPNYQCPDRSMGRLSFFVSRDQMDIEGLGPETLEVLVSRGLVKDIPDLYEADFDSLIGVAGFGEKKIEALKASIERSKQQTFKQLVPSLGISDFGPKLTDLLIENGYEHFDQVLALFDEHRGDELLSIKGIGQKTIDTVRSEINNPRFRSMYQRLKDCGLNFKYERPKDIVELPKIFAGQSWCVTGSFETFKPRDLAMDEVKLRGGRVVGDVSGSTTHLLAGEKAGSKLEKAQKLGIKVVTEAEFLEIIGAKK